MNDREYVTNKIKHMKRIGIKAEVNPKTGAARPDWAKGESEKREKRGG